MGYVCSARFANDQCHRDCYDFRTRRRALLFNEVRMQLRSFESSGLHVKSEEHPHGLIRKIFIVYNDGTQNPAPTFLDPDNPHVVAISHKTLYEAHAKDGGSMDGYPTSSRNALTALVPYIPDLGDWILYLEDDMFLTRPLTNGHHGFRNLGSLSPESHKIKKDFSSGHMVATTGRNTQLRWPCRRYLDHGTTNRPVW